MNIFNFTEKMERGQYSVNIATSLALESLMGIHPERTWPSPPFLKYDNYWMNLRTLYRNVTGAFTADINTLLTPGIIAELMHDEWEAIRRVFSQTKIDPVLYICNYTDLYRRYKHHTVFREDKTGRQEDERERMEKSIKQFLSDVGDGYCVGFDTDIKPEGNAGGKTILQSHLAVDLLSHKFFDDLELLESHTGAIKNRSLWYTKYNNGKELSMIPFNHYFLRIFGDKEFFAPKDIALRKAIIEIATKYQWNALTTDNRVRTNIDQLKNPYFVAVIKDMM